MELPNNELVILTKAELAAIVEKAVQSGVHSALKQHQPDPLAKYGPFLTVKDMAELLRVTEQTVRDRMHRYELPQATRIGREYRWSKDKVRQFLNG